MRTTERIGPPYELAVVRDNGLIVEVTIRATAGELTAADIQEATRALLERLHQEQQPTLGGKYLTPPIAHTTADLQRVYRNSRGKVTHEYLALLSVVYAELAHDHRDVSTMLSEQLSIPLPTLKGHLMRARREGFLERTVQGRHGGEPTAKAYEVLAGMADEQPKVTYGNRVATRTYN